MATNNIVVKPATSIRRSGLIKFFETIDQRRLYIDNVGGILAALQACVQQAGAGGDVAP